MTLKRSTFAALLGLSVCALSCASGTEIDDPTPAEPSGGLQRTVSGNTAKGGDQSPSSTSSTPSAPSAPNAGGSGGSDTSPGSQLVSGSYTLDLACKDVPILDLCLIESRGEKDVSFTLPSHMKRSSIEYTITPSGPDAHGSVGWASDDPLDGTVRIQGVAGAFSNLSIEVTGVTVVPQ